jgi:hypothetical protein
MDRYPVRRYLRIPASIFFLFFFASILLPEPSLAVTPQHVWSQRFGDASGQHSFNVAVDAAGNSVITGYFFGAVDFGGGTLTSAGDADIYVAKFDADGNHLWSYRFGDTTWQYPYDVAFDGSGNVVVVGGFAGTVNFGGSDLTGAGSLDAFIVKFTANGSHLWSQRFGDSNLQEAEGIAIDDGDNVCVSGNFKGAIDFGGGTLTSAGTYDIFLAKFNSSGAHQWSKRFGDGSEQAALDVAVDGLQNVYITGHFWSTVDFGGGTLTSAGSSDTYLAKFNSGGAHVWSQRFGDASGQVGYSVASDAFHNVVVTGTVRGTVDFGGGILTSAGSADVFVAHFDQNGTHRWSKRFGDASFDIGNSLAVDERNNVWITGRFVGDIDFGGDTLSAVGLDDVYLAGFDLNGTHLWSDRFGDSSDQYGQGIATGPGTLVINGHFLGSIDFGGGTLTSAGNSDIYLAKFSLPMAPVLTSIVDVGNDQGRWVRLEFSRTDLDASGSPTPVLRYEAFRRIDPLPVAAAEFARSGDRAPGHALLEGWELVGEIHAHAEETYNMIVPTLADSTVADGMHWSVFFVRASTAEPATYFDSQPDSGYSLDNLAPSAPQNLVYGIAGLLAWDEATETDFNYFSVYGGPTSDFGDAEVVDYTTATEMDVQSHSHAYFFVTATDFAGNEGPPGIVLNPTGTPDSPPSRALSLSVHPNPFNPSTTITYSVRVAGPVSVVVYDVLGRLIDTLVDREFRSPSEYSIRYTAPASSGVYFFRIESAGEVRTVKTTLLK